MHGRVRHLAGQPRGTAADVFYLHRGDRSRSAAAAGRRVEPLPALSQPASHREPPPPADDFKFAPLASVLRVCGVSVAAAEAEQTAVRVRTNVPTAVRGVNRRASGRHRLPLPRLARGIGEALGTTPGTGRRIAAGRSRRPAAGLLPQPGVRHVHRVAAVRQLRRRAGGQRGGSRGAPRRGNCRDATLAARTSSCGTPSSSSRAWAPSATRWRCHCRWPQPGSVEALDAGNATRRKGERALGPERRLGSCRLLHGVRAQHARPKDFVYGRGFFEAVVRRFP